jgi:hypothetical protein
MAGAVDRSARQLATGSRRGADNPGNLEHGTTTTPTKGLHGCGPHLAVTRERGAHPAKRSTDRAEARAGVIT